jgi:hypothetical protein
MRHSSVCTDLKNAQALLIPSTSAAGYTRPHEAARIMAASLVGADLRLITRKYGKPTIEKAAAQDHA